MDELMTWLFSSAGAGWVFGMVTLAALVFAIIQRTRPARLVFSELVTASLIDINTKIRDRITVTYNQQPIARLGHVRAEIFNDGSTIIRDAVVTLTVPDSVRILEVAAISSADGCHVDTQHDDRQATITAPYVNPLRDHRHTLVVSMLVDGNVADITASGGGEGWSLRQWTNRKTRLRNLMELLIAAAALLLWLWVIQGYFFPWEAAKGIGQREISARSILAAAVAVIPVGIVFVLLLRAGQPRRPKTSKEFLAKSRNA